MAHASSSQATRRSWLQRLQGWLRPAAPAAPAYVPRRSVFGTNANQPYVGELAIFCGNFPPRDWAFCDGSELQISDYGTLFNLIGTTYGGDGQTTFCLPDLRGRAPMHSSSTHVIGELSGAEQVTLTGQQIPGHTHAVAASTSPGTTASPSGAVPADGGNGSAQYTQDTGSLVKQPAQGLAAFGSSQPHDNMQPYVVVNYIISLYGVFPSQF